MNRKKRGAWWSYKRESYRYGLYSKRVGLMLMINLTSVIFLGSLLMFLFEKQVNPGIKSFWDAVWLIFVSLATIGYGDIVPVTAEGRVVIVAIMIVGVGTISAYVAALATRRVAKAKRRYSGMQGNTKSSDHVVICGWNSRGPYVVERLKAELEKEHRPIVLLADLEDKPVEDDYIFFFRGNQVSEADLRRANIGEARSAILLADDTRGGSADDIDSRTVLTALTIRALNPGVKMTAEILKPENLSHLELAKVEEVLDSDVVLGNLIARSALHYGLIGVVTEMVTRKDNTRIFPLQPDEDMVGKNNQEVIDLLGKRYDYRLIGTLQAAGYKQYDEVHTIEKGDTLVVIGEAAPGGIGKKQG